MNDVVGRSAWSRFWNRGRWWKAVVLAAGYLVLYELASLAFLPLVPFAGDSGSASFVFIFYVLPILVGAVILIVFGATTGWLRGLFARQSLGGRGWMWIAVVVVLLFNVLHLFSIDYSAAGIDYVMTWLLAGLFVGFAEEVLTRGYVVRIMRDAGHREIVVALVSAGLFALLHSTNLLGGQALVPTLVQIVYTFFFGILMYLAMRVTRTLLAPVLLHASTDPSIFMHAQYPAEGALGSLANLGNIVVIVVGLVLVFFIRGRVGRNEESTFPSASR
ncbi:CPBP family intramembrane glutamic endopeptidase [Microbacterium sp. VKM Ac-2923]|uniref:CPBP family intramembrane glutamic endopeptidase n=1 Tax=Microbacterium sp. VKM Ac-2923 TaxID=2929476 RepID=UPI001FB5524F|nr:CPBP family intramembrane glutamic endopeptidase [Microbacterium sp. VKM Ac-2923]MCJ1707586.1 CPBP family intramembrane metalloprotease [Microbacterium sp. VKM Ac-2923]